VVDWMLVLLLIWMVKAWECLEGVEVACQGLLPFLLFPATLLLGSTLAVLPFLGLARFWFSFFRESEMRLASLESEVRDRDLAEFGIEILGFLTYNKLHALIK
jgi:hypothetical protein